MITHKFQKPVKPHMLEKISNSLQKHVELDTLIDVRNSSIAVETNGLTEKEIKGLKSFFNEVEHAL